MKKSLFLFFLIPVLTSNALAKKNPVHSAELQFGLGLSISDLAQVPTARFAIFEPVAQSSLSAMAIVAKKHTLQALLNISQVEPFSLGFGLLYHYTLAGSDMAGFHVGGGFGAGTTPRVVDADVTSRGFFHLSPLLGVHYNPHPNIRFSVDGGALLQVVDDQFDFGIGGLGEFLGLSIHYLF